MRAVILRSSQCCPGRRTVDGKDSDKDDIDNNVRLDCVANVDATANSLLLRSVRTGEWMRTVDECLVDCTLPATIRASAVNHSLLWRPA